MADPATVVERLRADRKTSQFNAGGLLETYMATPTDFDLEVATLIESLQKRVGELEKVMRRSHMLFVNLSDPNLPHDTHLRVDAQEMHAEIASALLGDQK